MKHYGPMISIDKRMTVPRIRLHKISQNKDIVPIAMFAGKQDPLATPKKMLRTKKEIGEAVIKLEYIDNCNHSSFNFGNNPGNFIQ